MWIVLLSFLLFDWCNELETLEETTMAKELVLVRDSLGYWRNEIA